MKKNILALIALALPVLAQADDINVADLGVKPGGDKACTELIQKAIDRCSETGGGQVYLPGGIYTVSALCLKDGVELHLSKGTVLQGSTNHPEDYKAGRGIVVAYKAKHCAVTGMGMIDGRGWHENFQRYGNNQGNRPHAIYFEDCEDVTVKDVRIKNAAWWTLRLFRCDGVRIDNLDIYSHSIVNNDGIDVDARNVIISNCRIDSDDDGICLKSDDRDFMPENITVTNCIIASNCNPIKLGTSSHCGFRNVTISNCVIHKPSESNVWDWSKEYREIEPGTLTGLSGIAIEAVDGGTIENLHFSNISMSGVMTPIFVCLNKRTGIAGSLRNVVFSGITAKAHGIIPCLISGIPEKKIEGITLRDIIVEHIGKGTAEDAAHVLGESEKGYPENRMYGFTNPACGLYVRHASNVTIDNFQVTLKNPDARPVMVMNDVNGIYVEKVKDILPAPSTQTLIRLIDCQDFMFENVGNYNCSAQLKVEGEKSKNIKTSLPL